jgi:hypothetical protein
MNLTEEEQEEILTMLNMVFKDNVKGYLDNYEGYDSKELISIIEKNKNVVKMKHTTPCRYNKKKVSAYLNILYLVWILYATYLTIGIYLLN